MKYVVTVEYTTRREREITVYARDENEAEDKACEIVLGWQDVDDAEATNVDEAE